MMKYEEIEKLAIQMYLAGGRSIIFWPAEDQDFRNHFLKLAADELVRRKNKTQNKRPEQNA